MKVLLISLLIMAPLYLLLCQEQSEQMDRLSEIPGGVVTSEQAGADSASVKPLKPYQQQLEQAKGVEAMLNQGVKDRMRNIDGLDGED
mgnify:FL=1